MALVTFAWRELVFEPDADSEERFWRAARGWRVRHYGNLYIASWNAATKAHPAVIGVGKTPGVALDDCLAQLRRTLSIVGDEVRVRVEQMDALTTELEAIAAAGP